MRSSTGRWVSGDDFFGRLSELRTLELRVRDSNHVLLSGQRRMGKTSLLRELGRRLEQDGWISLFVDVEGANCAEDAIADIAEAAHPYRSTVSRFTVGMRRWLGNRLEEVEAPQFRIKIRAGLDPGSWRRYGEALLRDCCAQGRPVVLMIDELPIFLKRMLRTDGDAKRIDEFLSWLRSIPQQLGEEGPVVLVSGSIGLEHLVRRLGIPDRINHFSSFRVGPWSREESVACLERLAGSYALLFEDGVAEAVYEALGVGVPHQIQSFFARLRESALMHDRERVSMEDVDRVYRTELLGASGQNDLVHYETRLKEALDADSHSLAMEILAEAATQGEFGAGANRCLESLYAKVLNDAGNRIADTLEVLVHDGYLEKVDDGYRFSYRLLNDWWSARFSNHHVALQQRPGSNGAEGRE